MSSNKKATPARKPHAGATRHPDIAHSWKKKAKKWSKDKAREKRSEIDSQVGALYAAMMTPTSAKCVPQSPRDDGSAVVALEEILRGL